MRSASGQSKQNEIGCGRTVAGASLSFIEGHEISFAKWFAAQPVLLMEGALGERLKHEFGLRIDDPVAMADLVRTCAGRDALTTLWQGYRTIAREYALPFLATTPTRRANVERMTGAGYDQALLMENVALLRAIQAEEAGEMAVGGLMGCKGDAYTGEGALAREGARAFHAWQDCRDMRRPQRYHSRTTTANLVVFQTHSLVSGRN